MTGKTRRRKKPVRCHCGACAVLRSASELFGKRAVQGEYYWVCSRYPKCGSYVKANPVTKEPLGTLADSEVRHWRIKAHRAFDKIWRMGIMPRDSAYRWLQEKLYLSEQQAHIGSFSEYLCGEVIALSRQVLTANGCGEEACGDG